MIVLGSDKNPLAKGVPKKVTTRLLLEPQSTRSSTNNQHQSVTTCDCAGAPWLQHYSGGNFIVFLGHPVVQMYACMMPTNPIDLRTHFCILYFSMWILILKTIIVSIAIMPNCIAQGTLIAKNTPLHRIIAMHCGYRSNKCFRRRWEGQVDSSNTTSCHPFDTLVTGMHRTTPIF